LQQLKNVRKANNDFASHAAKEVFNYAKTLKIGYELVVNNFQ